MYVIDLFVTISRRNDIVDIVLIPCYDIVVVRIRDDIVCRSYDSGHNHLKARYGDRCMLLFTDTNSICCEIQTDDLRGNMGEHLDLYDTSNFSPNHPQYYKTNHCMLGKWKQDSLTQWICGSEGQDVTAMHRLILVLIWHSTEEFVFQETETKLNVKPTII